ncbi:unnamed protein product [Leptidea sinapis]|uniref:Uncharacterized protein n=1 Tax=Leptidea sinapis TaxID=189913 RepID=A0A5E4QRM9_9NEOP|nr:unnamed protein product [Leptidea sinapis]
MLKLNNLLCFLR